MTTRARLLRNITAGVAAFIVVVVTGTMIVVQTDWFREFVKQKIISATEEGTGGKVEVGSFTLEWPQLRAVVTEFVIHGNEPAGSAPFVRVERIEVTARLLTSLNHILDLTRLRVDRPEANVMVLADGRTNIPTPKKARTSNRTALETIVDLAVRRFELNNGYLTLDSKKQPLNIRGDNLRAQFLYSEPGQSYRGHVSLEPLYMVAGRNTPVKFTLTLPIELERDRIDVRDAKISTDASQLSINASIESLRDLKTSAHIKGSIALADLKNAGDLPIALDADKSLSTIDLEANAAIAADTIQLTGARIALGNSDIGASGKLKDPTGDGALEFKARLALGELGRLANVTAQSIGTIVLNGSARLNANNFELRNLRLAGFGGELTANALLENFARYKVNGNLRHLDLRALASTMGQKHIPYDGVASGPITAEGNLNQPDAKSLKARARISIAPGRRGVPVSGRLYADYDGDADNINISDSYIELPHTRVTLQGSLGNRLEVALRTRDLNDLLAAVPGGKPRVSLDTDGHASLAGILTGSLTNPNVTAHLAASRFSVEGRHFDGLALDANASNSGIAVSNGSLDRGSMQARFATRVGLRNWKAESSHPLSAEASIRNGDLADLVSIAGQPSEGYSGALSADAHLSGTVGNPLGTANLLISNGTIQSEPFDQIRAEVNMADQLIKMSAANTAAPGHINLTAEFQHPRESFTNGRLRARIQTNKLDLAQVRTLQTELPNSAGEVQVQADVSGNLSEVKSGTQRRTEFLLTGVSADLSARSMRFQGQNYGDFNATARTNQQTVHYNVASNFAGSKISLDGNTELAREYPTNAHLTVGNLPIERMLVLAKRTDIPAKGNLSGSVHLVGTLENPQGNLDLNLANAVLYDEPIDHVRARIAYLPQSIDVSQLEVIAGPSRIGLTARYDHPAGSLQAGNLEFRVNGAKVDLARIRNVQKVRPGLGGALEMAANGAATIRQGESRVLMRNLTGKLAATGISIQKKNFGDLTLTANTSGSRLEFVLDSNLADAAINGRGNADLSAGYPLNTELTFRNITWTRFEELFGPPGGGSPKFEAVADGQVTVSGPAVKTDELRGSLKLTRLHWSSIPLPGAPEEPTVIQNQGPIAVTLDRGVARIESLHLTGRETDIQAHGTAPLHGQPLDLTVNASSNLALLQRFSREIVSSGNVALAATLRGSLAQPLVNGRLELRNASLNHTGFPNGISNANGVVQFNGNSASMRDLTAESGGGKITMGGFLAFRDVTRFSLRANAANVRVRPQESVSVVLDGNVNLTGTTQASTVSGAITVNRVSYTAQSDFGSILSRAGPPVSSSRTPSPLLDNMKLDMRIRTSSSAEVRTSMAQNLQADADLQVRGTASQPSLLGRISITEGELVFFGSTYTVNSGAVSFYNPVRIEPVLDISLGTQAKGVDIVLRVTGPVDNMKLSYTSDPPLQFQEIVQLLAAGKTPTSDPTLLANQPAEPPQTFQQMGETAILSKALADPVASRLQRVFGVSQLKIDPSFQGGSDLPQARMTLQQQVTTNLTFTYVTALDDPNTQVVRIEWALNPQWSAAATRDQNGIFSINFSYKKQFR